MADYAALLSLAHTLDLMLHRYQYRVLTEHEQVTVHIIQSLQEKVSCLKLFLKDFPPKLTLKLEGRIGDVGHKTEDIIDKFFTSKLHPTYSSNKKNVMDLLKGQLSQSDDNLKCLCRDLQASSRKIDEMLEEVEEMKLSSCVEDSSQTTHTSHTSAGSSKQNSKEAMVGFEDELMAMKLRLCGESLKREIIPIVGMGGSGKTTLARHLYDDK